MLMLKIFNDILKFQSLSMEGTAVNATLDHPEKFAEVTKKFEQYATEKAIEVLQSSRQLIASAPADHTMTYDLSGDESTWQTHKDSDPIKITSESTSYMRCLMRCISSLCRFWSFGHVQRRQSSVV
jgi:hypothetical protein